MSAGEFRRCPFTGHTVIVAPARAERPAANRLPPEPPDDPAACPFCPGREDQTPPEVHAQRPFDSAANRPGWTTRTFPNKFPAVAPDLPATPGRHEVIVATPRHDATLGSLSEADLRLLLVAWHQWLWKRAHEPQWRTRFIFHNQGAAAGASQRHPHSQAIALPFVGPDDPLRWGLFTAADPLRRMIAEEAADAAPRHVPTEGFCFAWCPSFSRMPGEVWFVPRLGDVDYVPMSLGFHMFGGERMRPQFERCGKQALDAIARALARLLRAVEGESPAYNLLLHSPPPGHGGRWLLRIIPRTAGIAGLELGTGVYVNPLPPETAAARLRARLA